jgi:hypothetical protein
MLYMCCSTMGPTLMREMMTTGRPLHLAVRWDISRTYGSSSMRLPWTQETELASESGQLEVVQALFDHGADVDIEGGFDEIRLLRWDITTYDRCWIMMPTYNKSVLKV